MHDTMKISPAAVKNENFPNWPPKTPYIDHVNDMSYPTY